MLPSEVIIKIIDWMKESKMEPNRSLLAFNPGKDTKTFWGKVKRKPMTGEELIFIAEQLNLDLNKFKGIRHLTDINPSDFFLKQRPIKSDEHLMNLMKPNIAIIGNTRSGKTRLLQKLILNCVKQREKVVVISMKNRGEVSGIVKCLNANLLTLSSYGPTVEISFDNVATVVEFDHDYEVPGSYEKRVAAVKEILNVACQNRVSRVFVCEGAELIEHFVQLEEISETVPLVVEMQPDYTLMNDDLKMDKFKSLFPNVVLLPNHDSRFYDIFKRGYFLGEEYENLLYFCERGSGVIIDSNNNNDFFKLRLTEEEVNMLTGLPVPVEI